MMTNEQPKQEEDVTPQGASEINDEDLDQAAGGLSLNFTKIELAGPKGAPADPENRLNNKYPENN
jgi:hypothetical protein